jgi:DNA-binding response OmpR family regulator
MVSFRGKWFFGGKSGRRHAASGSTGCCTLEPARRVVEAKKPAMDRILLLADNDVHCRAHLRPCFSNHGFVVLAATNGLECLATLASLEPEVLVISVDLPWGGGDGVIARLEDGLSIASRPLILVTGHASPETLAARTGVPLSHCFAKPVDGRHLLDRIDHVCRRCDAPPAAVLA